MAGQVLKKRRLVNPGRRRHMSDKQIRYFGTARQKAGLRNRRRNESHRKVKKQVRKGQRAGLLEPGPMFRKWRKTTGVSKRGRRPTGVRRKNVAEILTVIPANPGRRRSMAAATRNRRRVHHRRHNRGQRHHRTMNAHHPRHNRRAMNPRVIVRYRNRRHNRHHVRRRNPDLLQGNLGAVVGVLGGAAVTKVLAGFLPANFTAGFMGVVATGVIGVVQGQTIGKVMRNPRLGNWMTIGGLVMAALELAGQYFPQLALPLSITGGATPVTTSSGGMGLLTSSNFFVPQVNVPGSMATFVAPAAIPAPVVLPAATGMRGLGYSAYPGLRTVRRTGRMR